MANEQNLIPFNKQTESEQRENARKGGKKSGEVRRKKKAMKETMKMLLNLDIPESEGKETLKELGVDDEDLSIQTAILANQVKKALGGNLDSAKFVRDTSGEYIGAEEEKEDLEHYKVSIPAKDMPPAFIGIYRDILNRQHLEYWLEGGRGSIKSTFANEVLIDLLENNPKMCAIIIRRYTNTLRDSVYAQTEWTISQFSETFIGLQDNYDFKVSPMEVTKVSTGQKIYFRGTDDPGKIKSIKPPKDMYIGIILYEEFDQIQGMNAVRKINQSIVRGGEDFIQLYVYNTPPSKQHFVNKEKKIQKNNRIVFLTDYRSAPKEWLGQAFIDEAEFIKETNPKVYENEYLGLETGDGGNVFENLEIREITDEEISTFDWLYKGIDWGWYPDPFAYNNMYYNSNQRTLYIFDELDCNKKSNQETWQMLKDKGVTEDDLITADSAEPKSIGDYRSYGANIRGAVKGPGSVEYSMKWLSSLNKIVIDRKRCPNTAREFEEYELEKDKDGNVITGYPDKNNHHIDCVRYRSRKSMVKERRIMFEKIITFIKGAINKMFNTSDIAKDFNIDISTSDEVIKLIEKCANIYNHNAPWLNEEVKSLNVAKTICEKVAKAVTIEFKSKVEDIEIDKIYQRFIKNIRTNTEYTLAKGGMFFKPYIVNGRIKISCIQGDKFIPVKFDSAGELLGAIFPDQIIKGNEVYTRLEYQELNDTVLTIKNIAYKGNKNASTLGSKIPLSQVAEWKNIKEETEIQNVDRLLGGYFKIPIANSADNTSSVGVPIFANAIGILEQIDKQFSRTLWEYEGSELALDVDITAFKKDKDDNYILPEGKKRLFRMLDLGDEKSWNVFSPQIRDTALFNGLNELLRQAESQCGLSFGVISKETSIAKTATEINSSKQDYYVTVSDIQGALQTALEDLIYSIDVLMTLYKIKHKTNPDTSFDWDDSIIVDSEKKQTQSLIERNAGLIDDIEYFVQTRDYSEEEAIEYVNKMKQRTPKEPIVKENEEE